MPSALGRGERKLATLLFADLSGYTDMTRRLDPEDVVSVVEPVMRDLQGIAQAHGGTVLMIAGDGMLCAFGVPHAREDDALRALRAAHDMRQTVSKAPGAAGLHAGVASGEVLVTPDSSPRGWGITGLCVAMATRLADLAKNGVILVDEQCRRLVAGHVTFGPQDQVQIQGMGQLPTTVAELLAVGDAPQPRARGRFVDRLVQTARLDELLAGVNSERQSRVVSLQGEAGTGKTRLVETWSDSHPEITVVKGRCRAYGDDRPLAGLLDALLEYLRLGGLADPRALASIFRWLAAPEASALAARLLGATHGSSPPAEDAGQALARAVREALRALSLDSPLVVLIDDVQWAGLDLLTFLGDLNDTPLPTPALVVAVQREGLRWGDMPALEALPNWASKQLVLGRLGEVPDDLITSVIARTGGNPLYLEESLNLLQDGHDEAALLTTMPSSVRAILTARLDALPEDAKSIALVVSAGADHVSREVIQALARPENLEAALEVLVARAVLLEVAGGAYRFVHGLFQEVAYAALTRSRRVELHLAYLDLLDDENPSLRSFHAEAAWAHLTAGSAARGDVALIALRELRRLGESVFTWQAAAAHGVFLRAEPVLADLSVDTTGDVTALLATHAQVLVDLGRFVEARHMAERSVEAAAGIRDTARPEGEAVARLALGHALARLGEMPVAREQLDRVLALAEQLKDRRLRGRALKVLAESWRFESDAQFRRLLEESFRELQDAGDDVGAAHVARLLAYLLSMSGSPDFRHWYAVAVAAQSLDDLRGRAMLARIGSFFACARADWGEAQDAAAEALDWGSRAGLGDVVTDARLVGIAANTFLGNLGAAIQHRTALLESMPQLPPRARIALAGAGALTLLRAGDAQGGRSELALAASQIAGFGEPQLLLERQAAAEVALDAGLWQQAIEAAEAARLLAAGQGLLDLQLGLIWCRAVLATGGRCTSDIPALRQAAEESSAEPLNVLAQVIEDQDSLSSSRGPASTSLPDEGRVEARAIWFENAAMRAADDDGARANWQRAHDEWARLGQTIWRQRAIKAKESLPRTIQELAQIPVTPLLDELPTAPAGA